MNWETLFNAPTATIKRSGRFVVSDLQGPHRVLSTSVRNGGQVEHVRHLVNHQSCEGTGHTERHHVMTEHGLDGYHDLVCREVDLPAADTVIMGTAANMNYTAIVTETDADVSVTAVVTAGVEGNATCAGEPANWRETETGMEKVPAYAGTINTILVVNQPVTPGALARIAITMTEGKSAALQRLAVPSRLHADLATGTGTDQYCIATPLSDRRPLTSASTHVKLGELVGLAARTATMEALRWQNGLEASYTRGLFHALGRYGIREATFLDDMTPLITETEVDLLRKNMKSALYEPQVGASAHALAAVCDRVRHGTLPASVGRDATVQQAATLAANLAARVDRWAEFRERLLPYAGDDPKTLVLRAIALGWSEKWRSS